MIEHDYTKAFREANYRQLQQFIQNCLRAAEDLRRGRSFSEPESLEQMRDSFLKDIGYPPPVQEEENHLPSETLLLEEDGLRFYRLTIHVGRGLDCYGILVKPETDGPHPLCMLLHGASGCPEMITGLHLTANYYDAGKVLAKQGWMVYAPMTLFRPYLDGEQSGIPGDARLRMDRLLHSLDTSLVAVEMWKIIRSLDVLLQRHDVIPGRAGVAGLSFGGFYTLLCAAADKRFDPVYASCIFADQFPLFQERADLSLSEFIWPGSALRCSFAELAALSCPRRLILESGVGDALFPIDNVRAEVERVRQIYETLESSGKFHYVEHDGQHEFGLDEALCSFKWKENE